MVSDCEGCRGSGFVLPRDALGERDRLWASPAGYAPKSSREQLVKHSLLSLSISLSSGRAWVLQMSVLRQCRPVSLHASRAYTAAAVDRYSTIHTFFSRQQRTPRVNAVPQRQYTRLHLRLPGNTESITTRFCIRQFSWTCCRRAEDPSKGVSEATREKPASSSSGAGTKPEPPNPRQYDNYPPFFRRIALSLPTHRPTREDFLNAANGFWQRARIRFRWLTIRSFRKYNADDISAFVTWFVMSQTLWLFIGTCV